MSEDVERKDLEDALKLLLKPRGKMRSENREPTREELSRRYILERKLPDPANGSKT